MKLYIVGKVPQNFYNFYQELDDLGYEVLNGKVANVSKGLIDADIILGIVTGKDSPIIHTHLGVALGDKLSKKSKTILIVLSDGVKEEVRKLYTQPYILTPPTLQDAINSYLIPLAPKKVSSAFGRTDQDNREDEQFKKNNLYMIRALAATLYSQLSPEHGEPLSIRLSKIDIDKIVEDIAIKAEILEPSKDIALCFTSKGAIPSELPNMDTLEETQEEE